MKKSRFTETQIVGISKPYDGGTSAADLFREFRKFNPAKQNNMSRRLATLLMLSLWIYSACSPGHETVLQNDAPEKDSLFSFFNINGCSRAQLAHCLKDLGGMGPKMIVINTIIEESGNLHSDSLLANAIQQLDNVILAMAVDPEDFTIVSSASMFNDDPNKTGLLSYAMYDDSVTSHYFPLFQDNERQGISLPHEIAVNYRPELLDGFNSFTVNDPVKIHYTKSLSNFEVMDKDHFPKELVEDRIVIVGYVGPDDSDLHYIRIDGKVVQSYSSVVTANIVLNILEENKRRQEHL